MSQSTTIPLYVSPSVQGALEQLDLLLADYHYSPHARDRILAYTAAHGTPTGCPELDREDEQDAEAVFVAELPAVPFDSPAWDREDVFLDAALLAAGDHPLPFGEGPDAPDADPAIAFPGIAPLAVRRALALPPISGGAPAGPTPTPADRADFEAWLASVDADYPPDDQVEPARDPFGDVAAPCGALD